MNIGIYNCGSGNFQSLINALNYISESPKIVSNNILELVSCDKLIIPGVGSFGAAATKENLDNLSSLIATFSERESSILGICLGMQLLFSSSMEGGTKPGISLINNTICHFTDHPNFPNKSKLTVPHVGSNSVDLIRDNRLFHDIPNNSRFYFTHSFYAPLCLPFTVGVTDYGGCTFTSALSWNSLYAVQFHPELSGKIGLQLLHNFICLT